MHPFELPAREPPVYDLSTLDPALTERRDYAEEEDIN
jgi:hypothetical protein